METILQIHVFLFVPLFQVCSQTLILNSAFLAAPMGSSLKTIQENAFKLVYTTSQTMLIIPRTVVSSVVLPI